MTFEKLRNALELMLNEVNEAQTQKSILDKKIDVLKDAEYGTEKWDKYIEYLDRATEAQDRFTHYLDSARWLADAMEVKIIGGKDEWYEIQY